MASNLHYCPDPYRYQRRVTRVVMVGDVGVGGTNPIRVQSMTTTRTQDVEATLAQTLRLVDVGCEIVRITAPTVQDARAIGRVRDLLRARGVDVPLVADIHFSPEAALEAADHVEKVRVNPGNYADARRFAVREYTDEEYAAELTRIEQRFTPLVLKCKQRGIAMRVGTNHGSLSDRIMNRYGDTPLGMVESALEFLRICCKQDYHDVILSMKASNPKVMIQAYRLLVARIDAEGLPPYPLHLGVTEAGNAEEGRVKSAIGIGALLEDGLGDTIRVSLTEEPEAEIPVARALVRPYNQWTEAQWREGNAEWRESGSPPRAEVEELPDSRDPYVYERRVSERVVIADLAIGEREPPRVVASRVGDRVRFAEPLEGGLGFEFREVPTPLIEGSGDDFVRAVESALLGIRTAAAGGRSALVSLRLEGVGQTVRGYRLLAARMQQLGLRTPIHLVFDATRVAPVETVLWSSVAIGSLLCDGIGDTIEIIGPGTPAERARLGFGILQGAGARATRTEYVACPSCGRTLFDLQSTTERIKARTWHLPGVKIAVMGCVVNGPGEMADADFGYVGGAPGRVNLYVGKDVVERNVAEEEAEERLIQLIKKHGRWVEPPLAQVASARSG